jgi:hypothetical protein
VLFYKYKIQKRSDTANKNKILYKIIVWFWYFPVRLDFITLVSLLLRSFFLFLFSSSKTNTMRLITLLKEYSLAYSKILFLRLLCSICTLSLNKWKYLTSKFVNNHVYPYIYNSNIQLNTFVSVPKLID